MRENVVKKLLENGCTNIISLFWYKVWNKSLENVLTTTWVISDFKWAPLYVN